ncbi:MAG: DNA polymerase Y family protein [Gammaproteobacteria bacterium]|nr:DNA polymerase Y family protein [Gammaproteobacteria bacterium]
MAQPIRKRAPTFGETSASAPEAGAAVRDGQLWLAVWLPGLALQAIDRASGEEPSDQPANSRESGRSAERRAAARPSVVVESAQGRLCVVAADDAARRLGIEPGLNLSAAFAFSGSLRVLERSPRTERVHLEALAAVCGELTPTVSLEPPESLLLDVGASLRLFGGLSNLKKALAEKIASRGFTFRAAAAPTPLAALWLARHRGGDALSKDVLLARTSALPLAVTQWPPPVRAALKDMGVETVGDCLRLPRGGFARRMGRRYLEDLDRALGRHADPRRPFEAPASLDFETDLLDGSTSLPVFVDAVSRMTKQLADELRVRQAQVREMRLSFRHRGQKPTTCRIELLEASGDEIRLSELLFDKLERLALPAPATSLRLEAGPLLPARLRAARLFRNDPVDRDEESAIRLVERLRGRLGSRAVHGLALAAEHRPERAWIETDANRRQAAAASASVSRADSPRVSPPVSPWAHERPLWILRTPQRLGSAGAAPCYDGVLRLTEGPERIESGWWDGHGISRDYYAATSERGEKLWVYRDRADSGWYLHGYFG